MHQTTITKAIQRRFTPLRVLAVVALGLALIFFGGTNPIAPSGPLGESLETEIRTLVRSAGSEVAHEDCSMMGNLSFGVTCRLPELSVSRFHTAALAAGWRAPEARSAGADVVFVREDLRACC